MSIFEEARPDGGDRLSRQRGWGKGVYPSDTRCCLPAGSASSFHRAAILSCDGGYAKAPYGRFNWKPVLPAEGPRAQRAYRAIIL